MQRRSHTIIDDEIRCNSAGARRSEVARRTVLQPGETLSAFIEASMRSAADYRRAQMRFHERGQAAWERYQRTGSSRSAEDVLGNLQAKIEARRKQQRK